MAHSSGGEIARLHKITVPIIVCTLCCSLACTATPLHTLCFTFLHTINTLTAKLEYRQTPKSSKVCRSCEQATAVMLFYSAQNTRMGGSVLIHALLLPQAGTVCPTFGPQRGPLVAQQSSVLHTLHLIQSQPSFFCTITPHWEQRMASPWVNMR